MAVYMDLLIILNFVVDLLLLISTNRLTGYPSNLWRLLLASGIGGAYSCICMFPATRFLGSGIWCILFLGVIGITAFGLNRATVQRVAVFSILSMSLGGIAVGFGTDNFLTLILAAAMMLFLCLLGFQNGIGKQKFYHMELMHKDKTHSVTALADTGNTLHDPVTGEPVIVAGADVAKVLLGLSNSQLRDPVATVQKSTIPGLRLIPYRAVGSHGGFLVGIRLDAVRINGQPAGRLVAFTADVLGKREAYQALAGGVL